MPLFKRKSTSATTTHSGISAEVNAPIVVTLYDASGRQIRAAAADVEYWLDQGFRRGVIDLPSTKESLRLLCDAVCQTYTAYIDGVLRDGQIDPSDTAQAAAASTAVVELAQVINNIEQAVAAEYDIFQPDGVRVRRTHPDTGEPEETFVDPGQVDLYAGEGWVTA